MFNRRQVVVGALASVGAVAVPALALAKDKDPVFVLSNWTKGKRKAMTVRKSEIAKVHDVGGSWLEVFTHDGRKLISELDYRTWPSGNPSEYIDVQALLADMRANRVMVLTWEQVVGLRAIVRGEIIHG